MSKKIEIRYMTTEEQHAELLRAAQQMGMSLATFARYAALAVARQN